MTECVKSMGAATKEKTKDSSYEFKASDYEKLWVRIMN